MTTGTAVGARAIRRTQVVGGLAAMATTVVLLVPTLRLGYRNLGAHVALETTSTLICGLVALLLYGRYRRTHRLRELLLVYAMALLSLTALVFATRPGLLGDGSGAGVGIWAAPIARLVAAVLILAASLVSPSRVHRVARPAREAVGVAAAVVAVSVLVLVLDWRLPGLVEVGATAGGSGLPTLASHPLVLAVQLVGLPCYAIAALVFTREASRDGDELVGWLGAAAAVGAWARINYLLTPTQYTEWLSLGDVLRLGFFVLLFVGAIREIRDHWGAEAVAAAESERRRLARDLHDGVVQELGYIRSRASLPRGSHDGLAEEVLAAANRAVDDARRSIDGLTAPRNEDLSATLERAAVEVGDRYDVAVHRSLEPLVPVTAAQHEALVRIMREAVSNAARHAAPDGVWVTLASGELTVRDDGQGFVAGNGRPGSFGLIGMTERAASVDALCEVTSAPGRGTTVRTTW